MKKMKIKIAKMFKQHVTDVFLLFYVTELTEQIKESKDS